MAEGRQRKDVATGARQIIRGVFVLEERGPGECLFAQFQTESWVESVGHNYFTTFANYTLKNLKPGAKSPTVASWN